MTAYFGYKNIIPDGTITAPESPGYEKENAFDWFTYTWWLSPDADSTVFQIDFIDPQVIDYFGLASHNLDDIGGNIRLEFFDSVDWILIGSVASPTDNAPVFQIFDEITATQFRFVFDGYVGPSPYIGCLAMGKVLALPEGIRPPFTPPPFAFDNKIYNSLSSKGQFLGRSVERFGQKITIQQTLVSPLWLRENWGDLIEMLITQPFFYSWNYEEEPQDTVYAWLEDKLPIAKYTDTLFAEFAIKCRCLHKIRWW